MFTEVSTSNQATDEDRHRPETDRRRHEGVRGRHPRARSHHRRGGRRVRPCSEEGRASPKRQASQPSRLHPGEVSRPKPGVQAWEASVGSRAPPEWRRGASAGSSAELEVSDVSRLCISRKPEGIEGITRWSRRRRPPRRRLREGSGCLEGAARHRSDARAIPGVAVVPWWPRRGEADKEPRVATRVRGGSPKRPQIEVMLRIGKTKDTLRRRLSHRALRRDV